MKKLNQTVRVVSIVLAAGVFAMGAMPDATAQQLPAAASALMELPGVGITEAVSYTHLTLPTILLV